MEEGKVPPSVIPSEQRPACRTDAEPGTGDRYATLHFRKTPGSSSPGRDDSDEAIRIAAPQRAEFARLTTTGTASRSAKLLSRRRQLEPRPRRAAQREHNRSNRPRAREKRSDSVRPSRTASSQEEDRSLFQPDRSAPLAR